MTTIITPADESGPLVRKRCFDPVVDERTRLLVLGSLPGERSLARQEYYANRQNRFWMLMSGVTGVELAPLDYASRLRSLLAHGVGLWDVVAQASREGSLDHRIRDHVGNDLITLTGSLPRLAAIAFNGATAARLGLRVLGERSSRYQIIRLPSSSPAFTLPYAEKLAAWLALRDHLPR
jgi:hypoxanthine-DNA glycosylase